MAIREYVGARYVPRFTGLYDPTQQYTALDVVDNGSGTSYIAKKNVPAGTSLTDTDFWFIYGATSGAILNLQNRMSAAESEIADLNQLFGTNGHKYIFVGDSYNNPSYGNWGNKAAALMGLSASDFASLYVDGGSMVSNSFVTPIQNYAATLTDAEKNDVAGVIFLGGINDSATADVNTFRTNFTNWCTVVKGLFPNCKIWLGFIGNSIETSGILNNRDYKNIVKTIGIYQQAGEMGATYISGMEFILHDYSLMASDGIHPTSAGGDAIAKYLLIGMKEGAVHIAKNYHTTDTSLLIDTGSNVDPNITAGLLPPNSNVTPSIDVIFTDDILSLDINGRIGVNATGSTYYAINASTTLNIGIFMPPYLNGKSCTRIPFSGHAKDFNTPTLYHRVHGTLNILGRRLSVTFTNIDDDWNNNIAVTQLLMDPIHYSAPTLYC